MNPPKVVPVQLAESLKVEADAYFQAVMTAVNDAPDGQWIAGSEEQVRDLSADFRRKVFQKAVQQRIDAAEAAFPPSDSNNHRPDDQTAGHQTAEEYRATEDPCPDR